MTTHSWFTRRAAAFALVAVLFLVAAAVPAWCIATGMWW